MAARDMNAQISRTCIELWSDYAAERGVRRRFLDLVDQAWAILARHYMR